MKKIIIIALVLLSLGASAQWISDGESGYDVRMKLNAFNTYVLDTLYYRATKIDSLNFGVESSITLDDTMSVVWTYSEDGTLDTITLPTAANYPGRIITIFTGYDLDGLTVYCSNVNDSIYFHSDQSIARLYLFLQNHSGMIEVISNGDNRWFVMKLEDNDLTP